MALLLRHLKTRPQHLAFTPPPLVLRVGTAQGPKTQNPTLVKGGKTSVLSSGRSAIRCSRCGLSATCCSDDLRDYVVPSNKPETCLSNCTPSNLSPLVVYFIVIVFSALLAAKPSDTSLVPSTVSHYTPSLLSVICLRREGPRGCL